MCTNADESMTFSRSENFVAHLHAKHDETMSEEESAQWLEICTRSVPLAVEKCPLCVEEPPPTGLDPASLLEHIADHMHDFSLHSLPWMDVPDRSSQPRLPRDKWSHIQAWISSEEETTVLSSEQDRTAGPTETQPPLTKDNLAMNNTALLAKWDPAPYAHHDVKYGDDLMHYFAESSGASDQAHFAPGTAFSDYQDTSMRQKPVMMIPFSRDVDFVGREDNIQHLSALLERNSQHNHQRAALLGLGGIG